MISGHLNLVARDVSVQFEDLKASAGVTLAVPPLTRAELLATVRLSST